MKRTKILATLGPASASPDVIHSLLGAGANAFRINMSHGNREQWKTFVDTIRSLAPDVPIIMDTKGPELRILNLPNEVRITVGQEFNFSTKQRHDIAHLSHPIKVEKTQVILFDDGAITMRVVAVDGDIIKCKSYSDGILTDKRKVSVPNYVTDLPVLAPGDEDDLRFCVELGADAIALSFAQHANDIKHARNIVGRHIMIIAKIENFAGVQNIAEILHASDGIMVARGDLGVEIPLEEVPIVQKKIIRMCNNTGKPVIVATQMLESMIYASRPTRAEVSDVANAIMDGADCIMLSGETAKGKYPVATVQTMATIAERIDGTIRTMLRRDDMKYSVAEAISTAVYDLSVNLKVNAIVTATSSGFTARMVARFRPQVPVIAIAHDQRVKRQLQLSWGVTPLTFGEEDVEAHKTILKAVRTAINAGALKEDDLIIATAGVDTKRPGSTNLIEVHHVKDLVTYHEGH